MAEKLDPASSEATTFSSPVGGFPSAYQWDEWFDGNEWRLKRGDDFANEASKFRTYASQVALRRGLKLVTRIRGEYLHIRAVKRSDS